MFLKRLFYYIWRKWQHTFSLATDSVIKEFENWIIQSLDPLSSYSKWCGQFSVFKNSFIFEYLYMCIYAVSASAQTFKTISFLCNSFFTFNAWRCISRLRERERLVEPCSHLLETWTETVTRKRLWLKGSGILPPLGGRQWLKGNQRVETSPQWGQQANPLLAHHASPGASAQ